MNTTVNVSGMTCEHCVTSVSEELRELRGVQDVHVVLNAGGVSQVTITSSKTLDSAAIGEAIAEAGYLLISNNA